MDSWKNFFHKNHLKESVQLEISEKYANEVYEIELGRL